MKGTGIVAIVPMKPLRLSKTRLADRLESHERMTLSLELFKTVVRAAVRSKVDKVWVVGGDDVVKRTSIELGAEWFVDEGKDLNDSVNRTVEQAFAAQLAAMYLPADLPSVTRDDIDAIIDASNGGRILTLSPAHRDGGTNSVLIPYGSPFRLKLGIDSFRRHQDQAKSLGVKAVVCDRAGLGFDLDTPDDLEIFEKSKLYKNSEMGRVAD